MANGWKLIVSSLTSGGLQLVTWLLGWWASGTGTMPQPAVSIGSTWTSVIIGLIGKVSPALASVSWLPTVVNLVGGWFLLGLALIGLWTLFKSLLAAVLVVAVLVLLFFLVFGWKLPVNPFTFLTNSTSIVQSFFR